MLTSLNLLLAVGSVVASVAVSLVLFRMARTNPNGVLVRSEFASSMTALLITSLLVVSWAWLSAAIYPIVGNVFLAIALTAAAYLALSVVGWRMMGAEAGAAPTAAPVAPAV